MEFYREYIGFKETSPTMENRMQKNMETGVVLRLSGITTASILPTLEVQVIRV